VDAIHLTCASSHGFQEVYSNDRHLLAAAHHFNLTGRNII
jgi:predicted nucleic acid-binding protein